MGNIMGNTKDNTKDKISYIETLADLDALKAGVRPLVVEFIDLKCPISSVFEANIAEYPELVMKRCNIRWASEVAKAAGIKKTPTFMVFKEGEMVNKMEGATEQEVVDLLNEASSGVLLNLPSRD